MALLTKYGYLDEDAFAISGDERDTLILTIEATYSSEILFITYKTWRCYNLPKMNCFNKFLILSFRRILYVICFLLGNSPASQC